MFGKFIDHCLNFPNIYAGIRINFSLVGILLYYFKYLVNFLNCKSYCLPDWKTYEKVEICPKFTKMGNKIKNVKFYFLEYNKKVNHLL